ncbi:MAG: hypothetical protein QOH22_1418 [Gemmatimonadaceae bacterium]|nr:hypothetical protein [Gemmatimonadaceae bacterium]
MGHPTLARAVVLTALVMATVGCKRGSNDAPDPLASSLIFDGGSPEAREALAIPVDFRLTEDNFARWEEAQSNLEGLPRTGIQSGVASGRNAIERAVTRLESSPRARRAIERTGLTVRDFVLETIALAQASEAVETGKSTSATAIPADNFQFVQRYRGRVLLTRRENRLVREQAEAFDMQVDTSENSSPDMQMDQGEAEPAVEMRSGADTSDVRDTTHDSVRDTVPVPTVLWLPARQLLGGWRRGKAGYASLESLKFRIVHDEWPRVIQFHLRDQLLRSNDARLLDRVRRKPSFDRRGPVLALLQQDLKQVRDSLRVVPSSRHIHHAL